MPFVKCDSELTLYERVQEKLDELFGGERGPRIEAEINNELGPRMDLARWLARESFKYHVKLYKNRPIYWHLSSTEGTFGAIVHYHRFTQDRFMKLRAHSVAGFLQRLRREAGELRPVSDTHEARACLLEPEAQIEEVEAFDQKLQDIQEGRIPIRVPWKTPETSRAGILPAWTPDSRLPSSQTFVWRSRAESAASRRPASTCMEASPFRRSSSPIWWSSLP